MRLAGERVAAECTWCHRELWLERDAVSGECPWCGAEVSRVRACALHDRIGQESVARAAEARARTRRTARIWLRVVFAALFVAIYAVAYPSRFLFVLCVFPVVFAWRAAR